MKYRNILVRLPNWVGDVVMSTPTLEALRAAHPQARITCLLKPYVRGVVEGLAFLDGLLEYDARGFFAMERLAQELRERGFDLALIYPNSFSSAYVAWRSGVPRRVGYATDLRRWLLTDPVNREWEGGGRRPTPMVHYYGKLVSRVGANLLRTRPILAVSGEDEDRCRSFFAAQGVAEGEPLAGISPGARFGSSKLWLPERFGEVIIHLYERFEMRSVILCGPGEEETCDAIAATCSRARPINTARGVIPLGELKAFVRRLSLMVTTDSGVRHYAVAFDVPVVVVMGPTDRRYTDANLERTIVVQKTEVECVPCHLKVCPRGNACMKEISAGEVFQAAVQLLERSGLRRR